MIYLAGVMCAYGIIMTEEKDSKWYQTIILILLSWLTVGVALGVILKGEIERGRG